MSDAIAGCEIQKIRMPAGRRIGDNMCWYEFYNVCVLRLTTRDGREGWGFGEKSSGGSFAKEASWNRPMPAVEEIRKRYENEFAPFLMGESAFSAIHRVEAPWRCDDYLANAIRFALWDLAAQSAGLPLFRYLGAPESRDRVMTYASACEFHLPLDWVCDFYREKVKAGFRAVKIKVGHTDPSVDIERLCRVRETIGPEIGLAADANKAWTAAQTLDRMQAFEEAGASLDYIEDPIPPDDLDGFRRLAKEADFRIVAHDYINDPARLRPLLETGALWKLRFRDGVDYALAAAPLAAEFGIGAIFCNTFCEVGIHAACALPCVERIEFADLAWNALVECPVRFEDGHMLAPQRPGHGFVPRADRLEEWKAND
jgi:L-alanine-DL-glutamate epimerase-like enolase superfamily enzyme